jgi:branched-chain amino acid aminotransferase
VVGTGSRGPVAEKLQKAFFGIVHGDAPDRFGWLTPVSKGGAVKKNEPVTV